MGTPRWPPCAPRPVQLRDPSSLTSEAYVAERAWHEGKPHALSAASAWAAAGSRAMAPIRGNADGDADLRGTTVPRPTKPSAVLPDCLASRFPGDLDDLERVVAHVDAARSIEAAADVLRPGQRAALGRAVGAAPVDAGARDAASTVVTLLPDLFRGDTHVAAVRDGAGTPTHALVTPAGPCRDVVLAALPRPLGFAPSPYRSRSHAGPAAAPTPDGG